MLAKINKIQHQRSGNFFLLAGPCAIEGEEMAMEIAEKILAITNKLEIPFIFKGSYRKANRSRLDSFTGIGDMEALTILKKVGERFNIPGTTMAMDYWGGFGMPNGTINNSTWYSRCSCVNLVKTNNHHLLMIYLKH